MHFPVWGGLREKKMAVTVLREKKMVPSPVQQRGQHGVKTVGFQAKSSDLR
jgi:hypothetical protein